MMGERAGRVDLVGAGPGDPGLLTRRGHEALAGAQVVVYDQLVTTRLLGLAPKAAERIFVGKTAGHCAMPQRQINELLVERAKRGLAVVRLKGGDPFVFGRGAEEAEALRDAGVAFTVVPGVTAAVGVTAYAGIPVTHRDVSSAVALVTGHHDPEAEAEHARLDWQALAGFPGTLVVYMGVSRLAAICRTLIRGGKPESTPAALIQAGTTPGQRVATGTLVSLPDRVAEAGLGAPALFVVGQVVDRRATLAWFETMPLFGLRIVVTRPAAEADHCAAELEALGAEALVAPTVEILPVEDFGPVDDAIGRLAGFDWLVFTSANGVRAFLGRILEIGLDLRVLGSVRLAAIGPATTEALASFHLKADLVPGSFRSEGLAQALEPLVAGGRVLLARADRGRDVLRDVLGRVAYVEQVSVYRNVDAEGFPSDVLERIESGSVDWITLTSSAIVRRLYEQLTQEARSRVGTKIRLASISPLTSEAARSLGWEIAAEASEMSWNGVVEAIRRESPSSSTGDATRG
ncbi:uroporphyrinogen-III C-methyltransferase [Isosphaeraceae bacterium EP7]